MSSARKKAGPQVLCFPYHQVLAGWLSSPLDITTLDLAERRDPASSNARKKRCIERPPGLFASSFFLRFLCTEVRLRATAYRRIS